MDKEVIAELETNLEAAKERFSAERNKLRTGRAHPSMVDGVTAEVYESQMPLNQLATVTTPEPQLIQISPFDVNNIAAISSAIRADESLGLNPADDGRIIRIQIPALTEERRMLIVKQLGQKQEEANISMRKALQDAMSTIDKAKKAKEMAGGRNVRALGALQKSRGTSFTERNFRFMRIGNVPAEG
ncbi:ribosome-recycling factor [uncultured Maritalea sp.]|uniref:ribosome-recycling factor n=1 Tax=uncultured Maritalea sp. TaxID=757249 RepID=UPI00262EF956|nr:ribosome-recycling factor [uncultured Maritalea sp.]